MKSVLDIQRQLLPDLMDVMNTRFNVLHHIMISGTIGRRSLALSLAMTERMLRSEVDFLKEQGLLQIESNGMSVTDLGKQLLVDMEPLIKQLFGVTGIEEAIRTRFGLKKVIIVPGDADESAFTKSKLGHAGAAAIRKVVRKDDVIAVTGGSTMAEVANWLTPAAQFKGNWFVPARGGLGESVELQANTIASTMAKRAGGKYRLLHVQDHLSEDVYQSLIQEPHIQELLEVIRSARIVVHGIGNANLMAARRRMEQKAIDLLNADGALAEAFGYYFDREGKVVHKMPTVGLHLEDIQQSKVVIAIAGGKSKGEAIAAVLRFGHEDVLVTDEAAANEILQWM